MSTRITLHGAAGDVTGSASLLETDRARVLVDFGIFQGHRLADERNVLPKGLDVARLDAIVVTHGHLDHTGRLPLLAKHGYRGPVIATPATRDLTELILEDAAKIQSHDAERDNRRRRREGKPPIEPLYSDAHVQGILQRFQEIDFGETRAVAPGVAVTFREAGHILGSASVIFTLGDGGASRTVLFSGDLGSRGAPILRDPDPGTSADVIFMESTYGDHDHRPLADTVTELRRIVLDVTARRGRMLVPTFAIGRAQQILYHLMAMFRANEVPPFPVYLDSPMARDATRIYLEHPDLYDEEAVALRSLGQGGLGLAPVHLVSSTEESKALNNREGPCMILAGAGMANAGRIVDHLRHGLPRPDTAVIFVGFQAKGTLGRTLVDGAKTVRIRGEEIPVRASVHTLGGFSAHAGQSELLAWLARLVHAPAPTVPGAPPPFQTRIVLVHGEDDARVPLAAKIQERFGIAADLPREGDVIHV